MNDLKRKRSTGNICSTVNSGDIYLEKSVIPSPEKHEAFYAAFEKPTQIYRYVRHHFMESPSFLHRNLSYMKGRMSRNHKSRPLSKVDAFSEKIQDKVKILDDIQGQKMCIAFNSIKDPTVLHNNNARLSKCHLKVQIAKVGFSRRKDIAPQTEFDKIGEVPINNADDLDCKPFFMEMPKDRLKNMQGGKTYLLISTFGDLTENSVKEVLADGEPNLKRRRRNEAYCYQADLCISIDGQSMILKAGDYELALKKRNPVQTVHPIKPNLNFAWKHLTHPEGSENLERPFKDFPVLRLKVSWTDIEAEQPISKCKVEEADMDNSVNSTTLKCANGNRSDSDKTCMETLNSFSIPKQVRIAYRFFHNSDLQTTVSQEDFQCPWCGINCLEFRPLCYHLKYCHSRLNFTFGGNPNGLRFDGKIDITLNESFDGSYSGNPYDLSLATTGFAFSRNGPVRRTPVTCVLVGGKASKRNHGNADPDDDESDLVNPLVMGHDRLYYHTNTCLPIRPQDMDVDSEEENDPEWMRIKTQLMIDDFTDVNAGEKGIMKKWNLHMMKHGFVGDCQMYDACKMFVEQQGQDIWEKKLYCNFLLHLCNLFDYGLIDGPQKVAIIRSIQSLRKCDSVKEEDNDDIVYNHEGQVELEMEDIDDLKEEVETTIVEEIRVDHELEECVM
ncbi:Polycomb protein Su(z)12 [Halotydeus destructor]|nr:Polycomb protein Su(z)12 [Halotydeus destructor]